MLQLTKRTEYGLIALVHLAERRVAGRVDSVVSVREISEHYSVPRRLLGEALKDLCRAGVVSSHRGATGGYSLAAPAEDITLGQAVAALEGRPSLASCESLSLAGRGGECDLEPRCPIRSPLHRVREGIWRQLERTKLSSLVSGAGIAGGMGGGLPGRNALVPAAALEPAREI